MTTETVPFTRPVVTPEAQLAGQRSLASGWLTSGPECAAFEEEFASWLGAAEAVTVSSCTAAIELCLRAMHLPAGSLVLVPTITFCGVAGAVQHAGHVAVLVDVDPVTGSVSAATVGEATRRVGGVAAMVVLHYAGAAAKVDELAAAAGLPLARVVEDAAHAVGTWAGTRRVGSRSRAACFSFYATKNLPIGEGGMVVTDDPSWLTPSAAAGCTACPATPGAVTNPGGSWRYDVARGRDQGQPPGRGRGGRTRPADPRRRMAEAPYRHRTGLRGRARPASPVSSSRESPATDGTPGTCTSSG